MALTAPANAGRDFRIHPAGTFVSICDRIIDLGLQKVEWEGQEKLQHKVYFRFQTPSERVTFERDGEEVEGPAIIGSIWTLSMSPKARLRAYVESWRGAFKSDAEAGCYDILKLLGKPAMLNVSHTERNGKTYANISGIVMVPKGMPIPKAEGDIWAYHSALTQHYNDLPEWLRKRVDEQYDEHNPPPPQQRDYDDASVPF